MDIKEIVYQYLPLINVEINNSDKLEKTILEYSKLRESINRQFNYIYLEEQRNKGSTKEPLIDNKVINIIKVMNLKIDKKILESQYLINLPDYYNKFILELNSDNSLNNKHFNSIRKTIREYQLLLEGIPYNYKNTKFAYNDLEDLLYSNSKDIRREAWLATNRVRNKYLFDIEKLFKKIIIERNNLASKKGHENYKEYVLSNKDKSKELRDITLNFVETNIVPLKKIYEEKLCESLNLDSLKPWDVRVVSNNLINRFANERDFINVIGESLKEIDLDIYHFFRDELIYRGNYDIGINENKENMNYCTIIGEKEAVPFIFMNLNYNYRDLISFIHEIGHAFHFYSAYKKTPLKLYSKPQLEIAEIGSMTLELIFIENLKKNNLLENNVIKAMEKYYYSDVLYTLTAACMFEEFERHVYTEPSSIYSDKFNILMDKYNGIIDMGKYKTEMNHQWRFSKRLFLIPFYSLEYAISQLIGCLILFDYKNEPIKTMEKFKFTLSRGNINIKEFLTSMNLEFTNEKLKSVMNFLESKLE
ncbi:M3 family metallopeptidase [Lysinibacillus sp. NPDC056959]|uniref:M3 family metallopeptidase n=1 Tax=Lysinibacillus sp. NPDC056959 TaxID=3345981 RepID=UPI003644E30C